MTLQVNVPEEVARWLEEKAKVAGSEPETVAVETLRKHAEADASYQELMAPVHTAFDSSGLSEDEAVELFEAEKHARRRERRDSSL